MVKDQAADLGHSGVQAGKHAAEWPVSSPAWRLRLGSGRDCSERPGPAWRAGGTGTAAAGRQLLSLSDQLSSMADASGQSGVAADLAHHAASRPAMPGTGWRASPCRSSGEVQSFARRRPAVFLALAAGAGLVAGRLTRGMQDADAGESGETTARRPCRA